MKRLLSLVAIGALVASMMPGVGIAGLRGAFEPLGRTDVGAADGIGYGNGIANGQQTPAWRPLPVGAANSVANMERWYAFTTRSQVVGFETSREIYQAFHRNTAALLVATIGEARSKMFSDPSGQVSFTDPAWSPNGKFLAYVQTDFQVTSSALMVQEYAASTSMATSITPIGSPIVVRPNVPGVRHRHPDWSPDGNTLAYDSDASGNSIDVYTIQVFPILGIPVPKTFVPNRAEQNPAWAPDGLRIAYDTNRYGPNVIEIVNVLTNATTLAETNFASVSHNNPDWASNGNEIYYDAPGAEDGQQNPNIWKLTLDSQAKCEIVFDGAGDVNVAVSSHQNLTNDGIAYNNILMESQASSFGLIIWRSNPIQTCTTPLPMGGAFTPNSFNFTTSQHQAPLRVDITFPAETQAAGYTMDPLNYVGREGVRLRSSILASPTIMGLAFPDNVGAPGGNPDGITDSGDTAPHAADDNGVISLEISRRTIQARLVALGLVNKFVPVQLTAYSNIVGRPFRGFALLKISSSALAGSAVSLEQNAPNPFNPVTKIKFAVSKPGNVALRVYNVRGELVKTIVNQHFEMGSHEASWDGRNGSGQHVSSGVYYAKVKADGGAEDVIKMVMAK
jgi:FlgD Ig-like domain/WD40-like Beta Propeller Repeat